MCLCTGSAFAQFSLSGKVLNKQNHNPVSFAIIAIPETGIWTTANDKGDFIIQNLKAGKVILNVRYLGYIQQETEILVKGDVNNLVFTMEEDNLKLNEVVITAKKGTELATSFVMDQKALEHLQMLNVTDVSSLLPGGKTNKTLHLATGPQKFQINSNSSTEGGNPFFGVAVEVDGVRLSGNSSRDMLGVDTRNISTSNVESIEVITGVASVEYGDVSDGIVKINTKKGVSPYILEVATQPNTKQFSLSKGLSLGGNMGVLNFNIERTKSILNLASPYTSYDRNGLSLNYSNTFNKKADQPITFNFGITGNLGGYDDKNDPDQFVNTYTKDKDNVLRSNFQFKWLLRKKWITDIEASGNLNFNDKFSEVNAVKSSTSSQAAIHAMDQGYHIGQTYAENPNADIILIPQGNWYEKSYEDNKLFNYSGKIKANLLRKFGQMSNKLMVGAEYSGSSNRGRGKYYDDLSLAPSWRPYDYKEESSINNYALYAEDLLQIPIQASRLEIIAGLRTDITSINGSEYGKVSSWSPRFNAKYIFWADDSRTVRNLSVKAGWGKSVKLPGFSTLYAVPSYRDVLSFAPGTTATGETFYAYYSEPYTRLFNPALKWQSNHQFEISLNANIAGTRITLIASQNKILNPYTSANYYRSSDYKFTDQSSLESSAIPAENRVYTVDKSTGIVTVNDKTGNQPAEQLAYSNGYIFSNNTMYANGSPLTRNRFSWMVEFKQIAALRTSFTLDGNYYFYKNIEQSLNAYMPNATISMANGQPYKYIGFFVGGANSANGSIRKSVDMNLTATTHIPAIRVILSARVEASLYSYSQALSQSATGARGVVLDTKDTYLPSGSSSDIYGGNRFVGVYPEYYISMDHLEQKVPFAEKFLWAKDNDVALYNELAKMVIKTPNDYSFNENKVSAYCSVNIGITKEIGRIASISFNATNFNSNMAKIRSSANGADYTLFDSSNIPKLYYGASLRLKF